MMATSKARANQRLAYRTELPMALGCPPCPEYDLCGGLKLDAPFYNCEDLCQCSDEERLTCPHVCRSKPQEYVRRRQEVGGFDLGTVGRAPATVEPDLPAVIPWIDGC